MSRLSDNELAALADILYSAGNNINMVADVLHWLGTLDDYPSYHIRVELLEVGLKSKSAIIRDGAVRGLAEIEDPDTISCLRDAYECETVPELKADILALLEQLRQIVEDMFDGFDEWLKQNRAELQQ